MNSVSVCEGRMDVPALAVSKHIVKLCFSGRNSESHDVSDR